MTGPTQATRRPWQRTKANNRQIGHMMSILTSRAVNLVFGTTALIALSACEQVSNLNLGESLGLNRTNQTETAEAPKQGRTVEQDVEAPEVFSATEAGLWDGRPSLGGVWVAHPDVKDPERVIIRNQDNSKFVVGALFRREREIPGPRLQISSDAAAALGILAGSPAQLNVTALRREEVPVEEPIVAITTDQVPEAPEIEEAPLDPIAAASAAIDSAPETDAERAASNETVQTAAAPAPVPTPPAQTSSLAKPFLQVGIFSVEANANRTASQMRAEGMVPTIRKGETAGKPFWRVIVGPAGTSAERRNLLDKIRKVGFTDAYPVTN